MIKYRVILSKKNAITIFIRYFENDTILGITIYRQTICSALLRSPPYLENSPAPFSPCMKDIPSPASLVFTPVPPERLELNCSNCEEPMSSTHQCCVAVPSSPFLAQPPAGVKMTFSDGRSRRVNMMKFCDNCDTLYPVATGCQSCLTHVKPP